jgi:hypothetical protein
VTSRTPFTADFETLDFDAIREHLARETRTPYGRELARDLLPSADPSEVRYRLRLTTEARHWLAEQGGFGMGELPDVRPLLDRLRLENATLTVDEIHALARTMEAGLHLRATFARTGSDSHGSARLPRRFPISGTPWRRFAASWHRTDSSMNGPARSCSASARNSRSSATACNGGWSGCSAAPTWKAFFLTTL